MVKRVWELYWRAEKSGDVVVTEKEMHAIASLIARTQGVGVVDDAMVERYLTAVHEHLGGLPSEQWDRDRENGGSTLRRIARIGLTAALTNAQKEQA